MLHLLSALPLLLSLAHADVASEADQYCTVEAREQEGTTCESCESWYGAGEDTSDPTCEDKYAGTAYAFACETNGGSYWTEIWCDGPPREYDLDEEGEDGCGGCSAGATTGFSWLVGLGLVGLSLGRRRQED